MTSNTTTIPESDRLALLQALRFGLAPRRGLDQIQVGREDAMKAVLTDIDIVSDGGGAFRFIVGEYGSGKSFFQAMIRSAAAEHRNLVTIHADISMGKRLHGSSGESRELYVELVKNMRAGPAETSNGSGMATLLDAFVANTATKIIFDRRAAELRALGGDDFAQVLRQYWTASLTENTPEMHAALQWFRGTLEQKREAKRIAGVGSVITNESVYDRLKCLARLTQMAGFNGLLVCIDELAELRKLQNQQSRTNNYAQIHRILNDCQQGSAVGIGFLMCSLPELISNTRDGLAADEGMRQRLSSNPFASAEFVDNRGPVIALTPLSDAEVLVLLRKLQRIHGAKLPKEGFAAFIRHCNERVGNIKHRTTRTVTKSFVQFLDILEQHPGTSWQKHLGVLVVEPDDGVAPRNKNVQQEDEESTPFTM